MIPMMVKLRKETHKQLAQAQDVITEELYNSFQDAVLHGGTAIWRCYQGNRFSEDIDAYVTKDQKLVEKFFERLKIRGFEIKKKKIGENSIYSKLQLGRTEVRFEAIFAKKSGSLKDYEKADGNYMTVYTLTAEELIKEKVAAYLQRRKIRDLYDIFFLLRHAINAGEIIQALKNLIKDYETPLDEKDLKVLILEGLVPTSEKMLEYIQIWAKKNT